jgi:[protein-PII] uridylyltransferase
VIELMNGRDVVFEALKAAAISNERIAAQRDQLRHAVISELPADFSREEVEAHFANMPDRYWQNTTAAEVRWGLEVVSRFLRQLTSGKGATAAVMDTRHFPELGCTKVMVCTWDRCGLLAQLAGYFSALRLNVTRAEVYTRCDNIALDVFWVSEEGRPRIARTDILSQFEFLLEGGLEQPPRFASTWACESHKVVPHERRFVPHIVFNNEDSATSTIVTILAGERLGLLHDILDVFSRHQLNICEAIIDTVADVAQDVFIVTTTDHRPVRDAVVLKSIERELEQVL